MGKWTHQKPIVSGFRFIELRREKIDAEAVNTLAREEMIDLLLTSYWDRAEKQSPISVGSPAGHISISLQLIHAMRAFS